MKTILDWAKHYVFDKGFSVIPLKAGDKTPAIPSWKEYQTREPIEDELIEWFGDESRNNIGIVTGKISGIAVVDLDSDAAVKFARENQFPKTPYVKTGRGYHLYYAYEEGIRNFQKRDGLPDIDLRGDGGYIVAPPSMHPSGAQYTWFDIRELDTLSLSKLPDIILADSPEDKTPLRELYRGVEEGSRNDSLARLVGSWVNDGLTIDECFEMAYVWNSKNDAPLSEKEVLTTVQSIYDKHHREQAVIPHIFDESIRLIDRLLKWNDILTLDVKVEYILEKLIPKNSITLLFGRGGIGKTSLMMQIAKAVASGTSFDTLQTIQSPVYYIDFENPLAVLKERVEKIGESENLYVWHISNEIQPPKLDGNGWELYKQLPPGLLIVDTLRASHLSDENDSKPMSIIMGRLKELREMGFTVLLLHHTPKGNDRTFKGSTALLDLCDHVLGLEEVKNADEETIEFDCQNLYRVGTRIKTRYEPYHTYLTFNPEIKGFVVAADPDIKKMEGILEIMKRSSEALKQMELREKVKSCMDLPEKEIRRLLDKGIGLYWNTVKGEKNATLYFPINSVCQFDDPIYTRKTEKQETPQPEIQKNSPLSDISQPPVNPEFGSLSGSIEQTGKQVVIDLEYEEFDIVQ